MNTLALAMIARNAAGDLPGCIGSARALVDEIVIGDTGSRDDSAKIAAGLGARVIPVEWQDDFAAARNRVLAEVQSDWVLILDADERLDAEATCTLRAHLRAEVAGYQVTIRNYVHQLDSWLWDRPAQPNDGRLPEAAPYPAYVAHENVRLFRRDPQIYFVGCVHETVGPRLVECGYPLANAQFLIHHFGLVRDTEVQLSKSDYYRELGRKKIEQRPNDPQAHFEVGLEEMQHPGREQQALIHFQQACRLKPDYAVAWFFAGAALLRLGHAADATSFFGRARQLGYDSGMLAEFEADAAYQLGNFDDAVRRYRQRWKQGPEPAELESKLGLAELRAGERECGLGRMARALRRSPGRASLYDRLATAQVFVGDLTGAIRTVEEKLARLEPEARTVLRLAALLNQTGDFGGARRVLAQGLVRFPGDEQLYSALNSLPMEHPSGHSPPEAAPVLAMPGGDG